MGILNSDLEFKVGEKVISYKENGFYESDLDYSPSSFKKIDNVGVSTVVLDPDKKSDLTATLYLDGNKTAGYSDNDFYRYQYRRCSDNALILGSYSRPHRYTQQLKSVHVGSTRFLFIETKLYFRDSSNRLKYTSTEERNYTYNITGTLGIASGPWNNYNESTINFQRTVNCTKDRWNRQDISNGGVFPVSSAWTPWNINLTGTITHHINGDSNGNKWYAPVDWD